MGFFDGLFGGANSVQTPAFRAQEQADKDTLKTRTELAKQLSSALTGSGDRISSILESRGALSPEAQARIDRLGGAVGEGMTPEQRVASDIAMSEAQDQQQRSDVASIFGRSLAQNVAQAGLQTGALKEKMPKRSGFDKSLDFVGGVLGGIFG
jgi:hypothetical protein